MVKNNKIHCKCANYTASDGFCNLFASFLQTSAFCFQWKYLQKPLTYFTILQLQACTAVQVRACCSDVCFSHPRTRCFLCRVFFFWCSKRRAGPGRAGPGSAHRLHVILQGGVWLKKTFSTSRLQHLRADRLSRPLTELPTCFLLCTFGIFSITCAAHSG